MLTTVTSAAAAPDAQYEAVYAAVYDAGMPPSAVLTAADTRTGGPA